MKTTFGVSLLSLALLPAVAGAVPCHIGCRATRGCEIAPPPAEPVKAGVIPFRLDNLSTDPRRLDLPALSRRPLIGGMAQNPIETYGTCDDLNIVADPYNYAAYLERDTDSIALLRHRLDVDARGYVGNADPVSGARGWWPGVVSWFIPMATGHVAELRVDYSSYRSGYSWSHVGNQLRVMLDGVQQEFVLTGSDEFAIELNWTPEGEAVVLVADIDSNGTPLNTTAIPIAGTATEGFKPLATMVGRRGSYEFRWSRGELKISSELSYAQ